MTREFWSRRRKVSEGMWNT